MDLPEAHSSSQLQILSSTLHHDSRLTNVVGPATGCAVTYVKDMVYAAGDAEAMNAANLEGFSKTLGL